MNHRLLQGIQKVASKAGSPTTIGGFLNQVMSEKAATEKEDAQTVVEKVKSNNKKPSSSTSDGMEERNQGYGHTAVDTDYDKKTEGEDTGEVQNRSAGDNLTTEASGIPDKSLAKTGADKLAQKVRASQIREKLQKHAAAFNSK